MPISLPRNLTFPTQWSPSLYPNVRKENSFIRATLHYLNLQLRFNFPYEKAKKKEYIYIYTNVQRVSFHDVHSVCGCVSVYWTSTWRVVRIRFTYTGCSWSSAWSIKEYMWTTGSLFTARTRRPVMRHNPGHALLPATKIESLRHN